MRRTILEDEHLDFRDSVRQFLLKEAVPNTEGWEAAGLVEIMKEIISRSFGL